MCAVIYLVITVADELVMCCVQIIVPMPCFDSQTKKPLAKTPKEKEKVSKQTVVCTFI